MRPKLHLQYQRGRDRPADAAGACPIAARPLTLAQGCSGQTTRLTMLPYTVECPASAAQPPMNRAFHFPRLEIWIGVFFIGLVSMPHQAVAQTSDDMIKPPFGLQWSESSERLDKLLRGAKAQIVNKQQVEGREAWTVEGLIQAGLKRTVFYFHQGALVEVELQYQNADWDTAKYDDFMAQVRRRIEQRFGTGQLVARETKTIRVPDESSAQSPMTASRSDGGVTVQTDGAAKTTEIMQTVVGYKWNQNNTAIQLFYYSAEKAPEVYRTVSVHYKTLM